MGKQLKCFCFPHMNNLSPAALAVWEAFNEDEPGVFVDYGDCLAAALRTAAYLVAPAVPSLDSCCERRSAQIRHKLLAIAAELETPTK